MNGTTLTAAIIGLIFLAIAVLFGSVAAGLQAKSAIHQIYQMLNIICSVLCFGFSFLIMKGSKKD